MLVQRGQRVQLTLIAVFVCALSNASFETWRTTSAYISAPSERVWTELKHGSSVLSSRKVAVSTAEARNALHLVGELFRQTEFSAAFDSPVYGTPRWLFTSQRYSCPLVVDPAGYHHFCSLRKSNKACNVVTYGVSFHFDVEKTLSSRYGCEVVMLDPTVDLPSVPAPGVRFFPKGSPSRGFSNAAELMNLTQVASLFESHANFDVVKMDCEGCEYLLYDVLMESDIDSRIDSMALEIHISTDWAQDENDVLNLGKAFALLIRQGMNPVLADVGHCGGSDAQERRITDAFRQTGYIPNDYDTQNYGHCQNILFSKLAKPSNENEFMSECGILSRDSIVARMQQECKNSSCTYLDQRPPEYAPGTAKIIPPRLPQC